MRCLETKTGEASGRRIGCDDEPLARSSARTKEDRESESCHRERDPPLLELEVAVE